MHINGAVKLSDSEGLTQKERKRLAKKSAAELVDEICFFLDTEGLTRKEVGTLKLIAAAFYMKWFNGRQLHLMQLDYLHAEAVDIALERHELGGATQALERAIAWLCKFFYIRFIEPNEEEERQEEFYHQLALKLPPIKV